jgi:dihydroneopterin aldolase
MQFSGHHGITDDEKRVGQPFSVSLRLGCDLQEAGTTDNPKSTTNYEDIHRMVGSVVQGAPCNLIEAVGEDICAGIFSEFPLVATIQCRVEKPVQALNLAANTVAIELHRERPDGKDKIPTTRTVRSPRKQTGW